MDVREKLVDIIIQPGQKTLGDIADHLIVNGVTVQECKLEVKKTNLWFTGNGRENIFREAY